MNDKEKQDISTQSFTPFKELKVTKKQKAAANKALKQFSSKSSEKK